MSHPPPEHPNLAATTRSGCVPLPEPQPSRDAPSTNASPSLQNADRGQDGSEPAGPSQAVANAVLYSCPFRARNPLVFNARDSSTCASNSFPDISRVKRHIMKAHSAKDFTSQCDRCKLWFRKRAFRNHSKSKWCSNSLPPAADQYDKGITEAMASRLRDRRKEHQVLAWDDLCDIIFPNTAVKISPYFQPPVEWVEACQQFVQSSSYVDLDLMQGVLPETNAYDLEVNMHATHDAVDASSQATQNVSNLNSSQPPLGSSQGLTIQAPPSGSDAGPAAAGALAPPPQDSSSKPLAHDPAEELPTDKGGY